MLRHRGNSGTAHPTSERPTPAVPGLTFLSSLRKDEKSAWLERGPAEPSWAAAAAAAACMSETEPRAGSGRARTNAGERDKHRVYLKFEQYITPTELYQTNPELPKMGVFGVYQNRQRRATSQVSAISIQSPRNLPHPRKTLILVQFLTSPNGHKTC